MASSRDDDRDVFKHTPLDLRTSSIRLIKVLPLDDSGIVQCTISLATIDAQYTCLSYVWGPPDGTCRILINGQSFYVRRNLIDFLRTVASQIAARSGSSPTDESRLNVQHAAEALWIDALCIDQEDNGEKNHQVQQMGNIFSSAQRVIAWIGKTPAIASLFRYARDKLPGQQFFDADYFLAFDEFRNDAYWQRAWITQEIQLARQVLLLAETQDIDLTILQHYVPRSFIRTFGFTLSKEMWHNIHLTIIPRINNTLLENMSRFRKKQCADPLDLVYSLLTISADRPKLQVAYGISKTELAQKIFRSMGDDICMWRARTVLDNLQIFFDERGSQSTDFIDLKTLRYEWPLEENKYVCPCCGKAFDEASQKYLRLRQSYMYCLKCPHSIIPGLECSELWQHILLTNATVNGDHGFRFLLMGGNFISVIEDDEDIVAFGIEGVLGVSYVPGVLRIPLQTISTLYKALTNG